MTSPPTKIRDMRIKVRGMVPDLALAKLERIIKAKTIPLAPARLPEKKKQHDQPGEKGCDHGKSKQQQGAVHFLQERTDKEEDNQVGEQVMGRAVSEDVEQQPGIRCPLVEARGSGNGKDMGKGPAAGQDIGYHHRHGHDGEAETEGSVVINAQSALHGIVT
jgi:hypothetical protein